MVKTMVENGEELTDFLNSTLEGIRKATDNSDIALIGPIEIELAVITKKAGKGKFKLFVVDAEAKYEKEKISRIKLSLGNKNQDVLRHFAWNIPFKTP
ncbi:MAG: trypco2 family protein [Candidatus Bathyarchaeia archaeon]|jgi:hypothetical protein